MNPTTYFLQERQIVKRGPMGLEEAFAIPGLDPAAIASRPLIARHSYQEAIGTVEKMLVRVPQQLHPATLVVDMDTYRMPGFVSDLGLQLGSSLQCRSELDWLVNTQHPQTGAYSLITIRENNTTICHFDIAGNEYQLTAYITLYTSRLQHLMNDCLPGRMPWKDFFSRHNQHSVKTLIKDDLPDELLYYTLHETAFSLIGSPSVHDYFTCIYNCVSDFLRQYLDGHRQVYLLSTLTGYAQLQAWFPTHKRVVVMHECQERPFPATPKYTRQPAAVTQYSLHTFPLACYICLPWQGTFLLETGNAAITLEVITGTHHEPFLIDIDKLAQMNTHSPPPGSQPMARYQVRFYRDECHHLAIAIQTQGQPVFDGYLNSLYDK